MTIATTVVSAPGKILLAGGYLVLESPNIGLVIAVNKRFYTTARIARDDRRNSALNICVHSPQFGQEWRYSFDRAILSLTADQSNCTRNDFVQKTLRVALLYLLQDETATNDVQELDLTIQADNDFYGLAPHLEERNLSRTLLHALALPAFLPAAKDSVTGRIFKTGLGSSACLVTSLVGALCHALGKNSTGIVFKLAQISHCHAQGKVGSGFDVSAACNGSHVYKSFPKHAMADMLVLLDRQEGVSGIEIRSLLTKTVEMTWDGGVVEMLKMQSDGILQVIMADVSGGSESPSLASAVLAWKKKQMEDGLKPIPHWDFLVKTNQQIVDLLQRVASRTVVSTVDIERLSLVFSSDVSNGDSLPEHLAEVGELLVELRQACLESRRHLKAMGEAVGVPIEPDEQTALADATMRIPGVIVALVPGAGGYDALACLYINDQRVRQAIGKLWTGWSQSIVCPLTVQAGGYGEGIRLEEELPGTTN
jgi:phosphomevalonate kinase